MVYENLIKEIPGKDRISTYPLGSNIPFIKQGSDKV